MNQNARTNPLFRLLGSVKLTIILIAAFAVAIAVATFLEVRYGTTGARVLVYDAVWFEILLGLLIINLIVSLVAHMPYPRSKVGYLITHIAFIIVLVSAGITRFFGYEGTMSIREGSSTDFVYSTKNYIQLTSNHEFDSFPVQLYKTGKNNVGKTLSLGGEKFDVTVTEYWPHFERRITEGPGGDPVIVYTAAGMGGRDATLPKGETLDVEGVTVHFLAQAKEDIEAGSPRGELVVHIDGGVERLAVPETPPAEVKAGGYRFRITEFAPDFRVGSEPNPNDPMNNPAIRVEISTPDGESTERLLFAFHPDFDMGHTGGGEAFTDLNLAYSFDRNVYLFQNDAQGLSGVADFALHTEKEHGQTTMPHIETGLRFDVEPGTLYHNGSFVVLIREFYESAVEGPALSEDENRPGAVRVVVTDEAGNEAEAIVKQFQDPVALDIGGRDAVMLQYAPVRIDLPYRLHLDDFALITYPGSENPASFESHVRIYDEERGVDGEPVRIYMNHPLDYRGFKHFQSSYDRDREGTILSVNHDPGKLPTYFGYTFVGLGFLVTLTRGLLWNRNPGKRGA